MTVCDQWNGAFLFKKQINFNDRICFNELLQNFIIMSHLSCGLEFSIWCTFIKMEGHWCRDFIFLKSCFYLHIYREVYKSEAGSLMNFTKWTCPCNRHPEQETAVQEPWKPPLCPLLVTVPTPSHPTPPPSPPLPILPFTTIDYFCQTLNSI